MISFRYHVVSIVAVFLALALGIVVGTTALSGPITKDLRRQLTDAQTQRDGLATQVKSLQGQVDDADQFAATYGTQLVSGALRGKRVLVVALPGTTDGMRSGVTRQVAAAGATISGQVTLTKNYLDKRLSGGILPLATGATRPIGLSQLPVTNDPSQLGAALLSFVLLGKGQKTDLTQVLGAFSALHMLTVDGNAVTASRTVVVLAHGTEQLRGYASGAQLALVSSLAKGGGPVVVAGDGQAATGGGAVAAVRDAAGERGVLSTVDDADNAFGQVSAVLALSATDKGQLGHYGTARGADALFPVPTK